MGACNMNELFTFWHGFQLAVVGCILSGGIGFVIYQLGVMNGNSQRKRKLTPEGKP